LASAKLSHWTGCIKWAWHFVWCAENWRKPRTKNRFWGCNFQVLRKTRRNTSILQLQSVQIGEVSH
jgi:hypothetical protein